MTQRILTCYYNSSSPLEPENIDGTLITHLIVGWISADSSTGKIIVDDATLSKLKRCVKLKARYAHLKVMVVLGDVSRSSLSTISASSALLAAFAQSTKEFLQNCVLDGIDLDWEFPGWRGRKQDRPNFIELLKTLRGVLGTEYLLTAAVAAQKLVADPAYNIPAMVQYVDFINLMCYDFNAYHWYTPFTAYNNGLFARPGQRSIFRTLNTSWSGNYWLLKGMPKDKIVVGVPTYAYQWKLLCPCMHGFNALAVGGRQIPYASVLDQLINGGAVRVFDRFAKVPYCYRGRTWISYEDEESIVLKGKWIVENEFAGAMVYCADTDDYGGILSKTTFPLLRALSAVVLGGSEQKS